MVRAKAAKGDDNGPDDLDDPKKQVIYTSFVTIMVHKNCGFSFMRNIRDLYPSHHNSVVVQGGTPSRHHPHSFPS